MTVFHDHRHHHRGRPRRAREIQRRHPFRRSASRRGARRHHRDRVRRRARHPRPAGRAGQSIRPRAARRARRPARRARRVAAPRHARLRGGVLRGDQDRRGPDSHQHAVEAGRLPPRPQRFARPGRDRERRAAAAVRRRRPRRRAVAAPCRGRRPDARVRRPPIVRGDAPRTPIVRGDAGPGLARAGGRSDLPGLARLLALFVGQHRRAQGLRAPAPRHGDLRGTLRQGRARHPGTAIAASASRSSSSPTASATRSTFRSRSARPAS